MKSKGNSGEHVYEEIRKEIMFLELLPGQAMSEVEIAKRFNVSRTPVRDAFKRLEIEGLIQVRRGLGTFVALINIDEIDDILYMREILETAIIREITALTRAKEIKLQLLLSKQKELLADGGDYAFLSRKFLEYDNELHGLLFELANKKTIWKRISNDWPHYNRLRLLTNIDGEEELQRLYKEHVAIVEAVIEQDFSRIDEYYRNHLYKGLENLSKIVSEQREFFEGDL